MSNLGSFLQENLLVLLTFDKERSQIIRNVIDVSLFGGQYRDIALAAYDYLDKYKKPPGSHLADLLEDKIHSKNKKESNVYVDIIEAIFASKKEVNAEYIMSQMGTFIKRQTLRSNTNELSKLLLQDTEESLEKAEDIIKNINTTNLKVFDPDLRLSDSKALNFLTISNECFPTGIKELDKRGFGPTRKEQHLYIADTKAGKSWWLIQLAKMAIVHKLKVVHITLEMSKDRVAQRYFQSLFAISKRKETKQRLKFKRDKLGRIKSLEEVAVTPKRSLDDPKIEKELKRIQKKWKYRLLDKIIIKEFPTGQLTVKQLSAYLDNLESTERFIPDLLVIDYPDLMRLDSDNMRVSIGSLYKDLRGLAVERNIAEAVVSQSHRMASGTKLVQGKNVAEDYSKIANADCSITYSQTDQERKLGLARLLVAAGRNDEDKIQIVVSQNYFTGQYAIDSNLMLGNYWEHVGQQEPEGN